MDDLLREISAKLDIVVRLLACSAADRVAASGGKQTEQIIKLAQAGMTSAEIAAILGTTRNTVSVAISVAKNAGRRAKKEITTRANGGAK